MKFMYHLGHMTGPVTSLLVDQVLLFRAALDRGQRPHQPVCGQLILQKRFHRVTSCQPKRQLHQQKSASRRHPHTLS